MVKNAIKVYARLKPERSRKRAIDYQVYHRPKEHLDEDFLVLVSSSRSGEYIDNRPESWNFSFFRIFDEAAGQEEVFESVARPVVDSILDGYNGTIFAYGQTGSGKTYCITGDRGRRDGPGIIPRALRHLFDAIRKRPENLYTVEVAYLEIYNENGYDLLERKQRAERLEDLPRVTVQEDESGALHLKNLTFRRVASERDAIEMLLVGDANRVTADTPMNPQSSRSHCIFTVVVSIKEFGVDRYKRAKMHLVDLAGSERVYKCAITGTILTEAKHINLSLHYLEQVIVCLGQESAGHIPYRNSLLTAILRDSLGGNCLTTMLATLSVSSTNIEETISTCRFAQRVALIRNDVNLVLEKNVESENVLLKLENERLKRQIETLKERSVTADVSLVNYPSNTPYLSLDSSRSVTEEEKRNLDGQIKEFLASNANIRWDNEPWKVRYCLDSLKNIIVDRKAKGCSSRKLEYYRNLLAQRDKEISFLVDLLKKGQATETDFRSNTANKKRIGEVKESPQAPLHLRKPKTLINPEAKDVPEKVLKPSEVFKEDASEHGSDNPLGILAAFREARNEREANISQVKKTKKKRTANPCTVLNLNLFDEIKNDNPSVRSSEVQSTTRESRKTPDHAVDKKTEVKVREKDSESRPRTNRSKAQTETDKNFRANIVQSPSLPSVTQKTVYVNLPQINSTRNKTSTVLPLNETREETGKQLSSHDNEEKKCETQENQNDTSPRSDFVKSHDRSRVSESETFEEPLPLTGDPEIDEEIIAFYKAKRSGGVY